MTAVYESKDTYASAAQEDRSAPRTRIAIPAMMRVSGSKGYQTVVNDISLSGFSAMSISRLHIGSICWLTIPGLESQQSEVIWWENGLVGCAFQNLLSPIVHDNLLTRFRGDGVFRLIG